VTPRSRHAAYGTVPITDSTGEEWASLTNVSPCSSARSARARRPCCRTYRWAPSSPPAT